MKSDAILLARHTFATTVTLTNGVPIESVSKMLGHRSLKTTQIYAKIINDKLAEDMTNLSTRLQHLAMIVRWFSKPTKNLSKITVFYPKIQVINTSSSAGRASASVGYSLEIQGVYTITRRPTSQPQPIPLAQYSESRH